MPLTMAQVKQRTDDWAIIAAFAALQFQEYLLPSAYSAEVLDEAWADAVHGGIVIC